MEDMQRLLITASTAIKRLTNEAGPECPICGGTTEIDGRGHLADCIATRLVEHLFTIKNERELLDALTSACVNLCDAINSRYPDKSRNEWRCPHVRKIADLICYESRQPNPSDQAAP